MARKRPPAEHENHERWLVSYADFITLLFAFFVVMFASSQTDKAKAQQVSQAVKDALENSSVKEMIKELLGGTVDNSGKGNPLIRGPGGAQKSIKPVPPDTKIAELLPSLKFLTKELETEIRQKKVEIHLQPKGLVISLQQATFFPSGEDAVDPTTYPMVEKIAAVIMQLANPVRLEGHTDSRPIHTARYGSNWDLSVARAIAVMKLLETQFGLPEERFAIAGYADLKPVDTNDTPEGRAHNRRVDIVILSQQAKLREPGSSVRPPSAAPKQ
jgi:chemotaxis protein MotB